ncbi:MAG: glycogen debranching enzyme family protein [Parachlamydiaceae bacterium]|nr:glycogen debranching enzyme family protein [Parachlamydiaceae bacterium]
MRDNPTKLLSSDERLLYQEWIVTNGLGGYACGSLGGAPMRKYNALLVAALKAPFGRTVMLNYLADSIILPDNREVSLSHLRLKEKNEYVSSEEIEFKLEQNLPVWRYHVNGYILEKRIWMSHGQNTTYISYDLTSKEPIKIKWRPYLNFRPTELEVNAQLEDDYIVQSHKLGYEISKAPFPSLKFDSDKKSFFCIDSQRLDEVFYEIEERRGYEYFGSLISPGYFLTDLLPGEKITYTISTEEWQTLEAMNPYEALIAEKQRQKSLLKAANPLSYSKTANKLILAADQFIITPISRENDAVRLKALGEIPCSIIAGYPWFTDWGRDTMISLEGLTLTTGRPQIAKSILRTFAFYIRDGLIPNMFPDGKSQGLYHTADATLWFFHAVDRYVTLTGDDDFLEFMIPKFQHIIERHLKGTLFGIKVDPSDGLLIQGEEGYQLTWMDAKVKDWVVTPRRGKNVEINALWYNALKLMELWTGVTNDITKLCYQSFNEKFWFESGGYLYDVIDFEGTPDTALRPNQILAISLRFPILQNNRWQSVVDIAHKELLTKYGLKTLASSHPDYKSSYDGNLWARDAAYHQGTVWPWLIGPFVDAWLKVYPDKLEEAKDFLIHLENHIDDHCAGTISEIFDAEDPFHARGCFAQAWSVAEYLRVYAKLHPDISSHV